MKVKLIHSTNEETKKVIANLERKEDYIEIKYREQPGVNVILQQHQNHIYLEKMGNVNLHVEHRLHKKINVDFRIKMGDQVFSGTNKIRTTYLELSKGKIVLEYRRDNEVIKQKWIYE